MRCVSCNRVLSDDETISNKPGTNECEDLCNYCKGRIHKDSMPGYDTEWKQFQGHREGLQIVRLEDN